MNSVLKAAVGTAFAVALATPAAAAVATTCAASTSCTLAELAAGDTITVNGIIYSFANVGTQELFDTFPGVTLPPLDSIIVSGDASDISKSILSFDLSAQPLQGTDFEQAQELFFDLIAASATPSSLVIDGGRFSNVLYEAFLDGGQAALTADGNGNPSFLYIATTSFGVEGVNDEPASYANLDQLFLSVVVQAAGFGDNAFISFSGFDIELDISSIVAQVPLPAALPLFVAGLGGLGFFGRWRRKA